MRMNKEDKRRREEYQNRLLDYARKHGTLKYEHADYPELFGMTFEEYEKEPWSRKGRMTLLAFSDVIHAYCQWGWKVFGVEKYDELWEQDEWNKSRNFKSPRPSDYERNYPGGYGTPIDWDVVISRPIGHANIF